MDLPNLFNKLGHQSEIKHTFLAVEITTEVVKTALWSVTQGKLRIEEVGKSQPLAATDNAALVTAIDASLSGLTLKSNSDDSFNVIFGLPETWISHDSLTDSGKDSLKFICQKLQLKPVGYVVSTEAVVNYLADKEGGPLSAILVGIGNNELTVSLVKLGVIEGTQVVGRSPQIADDLEEGLARFPKIDNLPSRIILYDGNKDLEHQKQLLIAHDWQRKNPFVHIPKIDSLASDDTIKAIAEAGGREMAASMGIIGQGYTEAKSPPAKTAPKPAEIVTNNSESSPLENFGFATVKSEQQPEDFHLTTPALENQLEPIDDDEDFITWNRENSVDHEEIDNLQAPNLHSNSANAPRPQLKNLQKTPVQKITDIFKNIPNLLPNPKMLKNILRFKSKNGSDFPTSKDKGRKLAMPLPLPLIIGLTILLVLGIGGIAAYWTLPKAEVSVYLTLQPLQKQTSFTLTPANSDLEATSSSLPSTLEALTVEGSKETFTSGSKVVGDRATGVVTVFNRTSAAKSFDAGTIISSGDLKYRLDESVTVASASAKENADFSVTIEPSKVEVAVTAAAIGSQYNIAKDTKLQIANFGEDSFVARSSQEISGGSSREVQAVDEEDQAKLKRELLVELEEKIAQQITSQTMGQEGVVISDEYEVISEEFSADVGEEAKSLSLSLSLSKPVYRYAYADVTSMGEQLVRDQIPANFVLKPDATSVDIISTTINSDETVDITADIKLQLFPKLDPQEVTRNIMGKYVPTAETYLQSLPGYVRHESKFNFKLPAKLNTFPRTAEKLTVKLKPAN